MMMIITIIITKIITLYSNKWITGGFTKSRIINYVDYLHRRRRLKEGGIKNVDIKAKIISLQCSWDKKLFDDNHHD